MYLKRIGLNLNPDNLRPDFELLRKLQYAHVTTVPYENLDIIRRVPLELTFDALYDKIVRRERGGYCFELNCAFNWLLRQLGYQTQSCFARYLRGENDIPMRRHRVIIVTSPFIDGRALCDVGIGERAPRYPLKLEADTIQEQFGETYQFNEDDDFGWVLADLHEEKWGVFFAFTEEKQLEVDFKAISFWCEHSPESPFRSKLMVSIKTDLGRKTIADMSYKIFESNGVTEHIIADQLELYRVLREEFGIISE